MMYAMKWTMMHAPVLERRQLDLYSHGGDVNDYQQSSYILVYQFVTAINNGLTSFP